MISTTIEAASVAVATGAFNATAPRAGTVERLWQIDVALFATGAAIALVLAVRWLAKSRNDPLARAPRRENSIPAEMLFLPFLAFLGVGMAAAPLLEWALYGRSEFAATLIAASAGMLAAIGACIWIGNRFFAGGLRRFMLGDGRVTRGAALGIVFLLVSLPLCQLLFEATMRAFQAVAPDYPMPEHGVIQALRDATRPFWLAPVLWVGAIVVAPIAEECFFRGVLQTGIANLVESRWFAVLVTAVLFGVAHGAQWHAVPALAVLGVLLGCLYERSGSLIGPITLHALFNLKTLLWEAWGAGP